jgi:hypothetical protein
MSPFSLPIFPPHFPIFASKSCRPFASDDKGEAAIHFFFVPQLTELPS